jgi:hypothetical protein
MNLSLGGYVEAEAQDGGSRLQIDEEVYGVFNELAADAAAFVYGRKMYDARPCSIRETRCLTSRSVSASDATASRRGQRKRGNCY